jgi:hypothetical protein
MAGGERGWSGLFRIALMTGVLLVATTGCMSGLREFAEEHDLDLEGVVGELQEQRREQRAGHDPFGGDENRLQGWCMAWADAQQGPLRDGMFPGAIRTQDSIQYDPSNMEPHYDIVWPALMDAYELAPDEIKEHIYEVGELVKQEGAALAAHGWNLYDAVESGALDMGLGYATEKGRWIAPVQEMAETWCLEDPDLRGPLD